MRVVDHPSKNEQEFWKRYVTVKYLILSLIFVLPILYFGAVRAQHPTAIKNIIKFKFL